MLLTTTGFTKKNHIFIFNTHNRNVYLQQIIARIRCHFSKLFPFSSSALKTEYKQVLQLNLALNSISFDSLDEF
jgi:hypothetical protein